jgi:hypothetical protein
MCTAASRGTTLLLLHPWRGRPRLWQKQVLVPSDALMPVASVHYMRVVCVQAEARPCKGCALMYVGNSNSATRYVSESDQQSDNRQAGTALFATGVSVTVPAAVWYRPIRLPVSRPMRTRDWRPLRAIQTRACLPVPACAPHRRPN